MSQPRFESTPIQKCMELLTVLQLMICFSFLLKFIAKWTLKSLESIETWGLSDAQFSDPRICH